MILASSTIQDLNDKMTPENRFSYLNLRGNIVVEGSEKYAEDKWKWMKIGEQAIFRTVKLCTRYPNNVHFCRKLAVFFRGTYNIKQGYKKKAYDAIKEERFIGRETFTGVRLFDF